MHRSRWLFVGRRQLSTPPISRDSYLRAAILSLGLTALVGVGFPPPWAAASPTPPTQLGDAVTLSAPDNFPATEILSAPDNLPAPDSFPAPEILPAPDNLPAPDTPDFTGCGGVNVAAVNPEFEQEMLALINLRRLENGNLPPLKHVDQLSNAARYHAADMVQDAYFDHDTYDRSGGSLVFRCGFGDRIGGFYPGWQNIAENIAAGYGTSQQAMAALMNSAGHRANILSTTVWEMGAGYHGGGPYGHYWGQDFGRRRNVFPLIINREAVSTTSPNVQLYLYGGWSEVRLRNENGSFGPWQPFANSMAWTLSTGPAGTRTVYAEMRTGATSTGAADEIFLTTALATNSPPATAMPPTATPQPSHTASPQPSTTATPAPPTTTRTPTRTTTPVRTSTSTRTRTPTRTATPPPTQTVPPPPTSMPAAARGDCNGDGAVNAGDLSALSLEIFDGDGFQAAAVPGGTFPGHPIGCDANGDHLVTAGDISCTVLLIFEGPGTCQ